MQNLEYLQQFTPQGQSLHNKHLMLRALLTSLLCTQRWQTEQLFESELGKISKAPEFPFACNTPSDRQTFNGRHGTTFSRKIKKWTNLDSRHSSFVVDPLNLVPRVSSLLYLYSGIQEAVWQSDWLFIILRRNSVLRVVNDLGIAKFDIKPDSLPFPTIICNLFPKFGE